MPRFALCRVNHARFLAVPNPGIGTTRLCAITICRSYLGVSFESARDVCSIGLTGILEQSLGSSDCTSMQFRQSPTKNSPSRLADQSLEQSVEFRRRVFHRDGFRFCQPHGVRAGGGEPLQRRQVAELVPIDTESPLDG
jgi:hypothetical protein